MVKKSLEDLCKMALEQGAKDCKIIDVSTVKTAAGVEYKCRFGCSGYGESLACPPYTPTPEKTQKVLEGYTKGLLIHSHLGAKKDVSKVAVEIEKQAFWAGYYKAWAMVAGPCRLCQDCDPKSLCRHAEEARPSMEACGIDVFQTVRDNGFQIETLDSHKCKSNLFALLLVE